MKTKNERKLKMGISLIVLVITIIVMIILAATVIISLTNNGIIGKANEAVEKTDLKQVQTIAQTIWSEVYLENLEKTEEAKLDYKTEITNRLKAQNIDTDKYDIIVVQNGVTVKLKGEITWETIYTGTTATTNGMLQLPAGFNFVSNLKYKITIEGLGEVITTALYGGEQNGMDMYGLLAIDNNTLIGVESMEDYEQKLGQLSASAVMVFGMYSPENSTCGLMFKNATTPYKVTKIEQQSAIKVFEGNLIIGLNQFIEMKQLDIERRYLIVWEYDSYEYSQVANANPVMNCNVASGRQDTSSYVLICSGWINAVFTGDRGEFVVKQIYDLGENGWFYEEDGFVVYKEDEDVVLVDTPNREYLVPTTVDGLDITEYWLDHICGVPTFTKSVVLDDSGDANHWGTDTIRVTTDDLSFITNTEGLEEIDISGCSNAVEIPTAWLNNSDVKIYVSEAVKARYTDYAHVLVKE